ncbi:hypothetical protein U1Q18_050004 [Sarracenia purpurea var. burkii]
MFGENPVPGVAKRPASPRTHRVGFCSLDVIKESFFVRIANDLEYEARKRKSIDEDESGDAALCGIRGGGRGRGRRNGRTRGQEGSGGRKADEVKMMETLLHVCARRPCEKFLYEFPSHILPAGFHSACCLDVLGNETRSLR